MKPQVLTTRRSPSREIKVGQALCADTVTKDMRKHRIRHEDSDGKDREVDKNNESMKILISRGHTFHQCREALSTGDKVLDAGIGMKNNPAACMPEVHGTHVCCVSDT